MATDKTVQFVVKGLPQLQRAFKQIEAGEKNGLKDAFLPIAQKVAGKVQQRMPHRSGRAQSSVKGKSSNYGASIAAGGNAAPYYPWLDFGGSVGRGHRPGVPWSGAVRRTWMGVPSGSGRYLYPAISEMRDETAEAAQDAIANLAERNGFEVRG